MRKYFLIIGILIFVLILWNIDLAESIEILLNVNMQYLLIAVLLAVAGFAVKSVKWGVLIQVHEPAFNYWRWIPEGIKYFLIGFSLSVLTPGRVGDFSRAMYLRKYLKTGTALSTVLVDRIIDVGMLLLIGIIALVSFAVFFRAIIIPPEIIGLALLVFGAGVYVITHKHWVQKLVRPFFYALVPEKYQGRMKLSFEDLYASLHRMGKERGRLGLAVGWGLLSWVMVVISVYFMGLAVGIPASLFWFMFLLVPVSNLLDIIPISVSGIGTREAAFIFLLGFYGIGAEQAVAFSILYLLSGYLLFGSLGALLLSANPVPLNKREELV